jgi:hypothetical protein
MFRLCIIMLFSCFIFGCDNRQSSHSMKEIDEIDKSLRAALSPIEIPKFLPASFGQLNDIQSPFISRKQTYKNIFSMKSFVELDWRLVGEVKKENNLLGVFLRSQKGVQYFGIGLLLADNRWCVRGVTNESVALEDAQGQVRWTLFYGS